MFRRTHMWTFGYRPLPPAPTIASPAPISFLRCRPVKTSIRRKLVLYARHCTQQAAKSKLFSFRPRRPERLGLLAEWANFGHSHRDSCGPPGGRAAKMRQSSICSEMLSASSTSITAGRCPPPKVGGAAGGRISGAVQIWSGPRQPASGPTSQEMADADVETI